MKSFLVGGMYYNNFFKVNKKISIHNAFVFFIVISIAYQGFGCFSELITILMPVYLITAHKEGRQYKICLFQIINLIKDTQWILI